MGGYGSGRSTTRYTVEDCVKLSISWMLQQGWLEASGHQSIRWSNVFGADFGSLNVWVSKSESSLSFHFYGSWQDVSAESTPARFGGVRWWFLCPGCNRRCTALYRSPGRVGFFCRICLNLTYQSCNESGQKVMGYTTRQLATAIKEKNWWRYPRWRRKRDRRPDYRDRGAWLREIVGDRMLI